MICAGTEPKKPSTMYISRLLVSAYRWSKRAVISPITVLANVDEGWTGDASPHPGKVTEIWCNP